ncbi:MAG: hypothetical protein IKG59_06845, partial [Firmicutes bacterium]|nr:hypothetical protein [Bacillota bacterium]
KDERIKDLEEYRTLLSENEELKRMIKPQSEFPMYDIHGHEQHPRRAALPAHTEDRGILKTKDQRHRAAPPALTPAAPRCSL